MTSSELRGSFLDFFKSKGHHIVPSAPVVLQDDPTLLFTNAGMNQFKDIFLDTRQVSHPRVADSQKCIRVSGKHNDLEQVGRDTYHHTFFEMLGNWSFGDYFKKEAIEWAWELLTEVWKLPKSRLYATVFKGNEADGVPRDDEAADHWKNQTDIEPSHILAFDKTDNFWEMGDTGPCGPCSEIHIDRGEGFCDSTDPDHICQVNSGCARFIELWNLVFIQYNRDAAGVLHMLPAKHVDTGAGFERLVAVMQGKKSNYDTDIFKPLLERIAVLTGKEYGEGEQGVAFRVIADHIRALSFAIADGAIPGNEGRGYVLRRLLRRAARFGRVLDMHEPFIYKLVESLAAEMGQAYPELLERQEYIARVIKAEEESFGRTLDRGIEIFEQKAAAVHKTGTAIFPGKDAFVLHDTYGFPLDLTQLMAEEKNLTVDSAEFNVEMEKQRQRSSKLTTYQTIKIDDSRGGSEFVGYTADSAQAHVVQYADGKLVLSITPFYAESGGQVGDVGVIENENMRFTVTDTRTIGEHIVHFGEIVGGGAPKVGDLVTATIDVKRRRATERNHTVTHLVHKALRQVLGNHISQAGSLVHPDYLRFDFTHFERVRPDELERVETIVNEQILENRRTVWKILPIQEAKKQGATALFGEKYGETVRMVEIEDFSKELCGGTHVRATGEIGGFVIMNETSVAAGIRRIECLTGMKTHTYFRTRSSVLEKVAELLSCTPDETRERLSSVLEERKHLEQEIKRLRQDISKSAVLELLNCAKETSGIKYIAAQVHASSVDDLRHYGDLIRDSLGSGVAVLGAVIDDKVAIACIVTQDIIRSKGLKAGEIVKKVASFAGGGGGGAPHMALAGARDVEKLPLALSKVEDVMNELAS
ncbi:alanine--tRNA ligase [candidate division KSB1 bacterium]|nr:alanine--tRNA ligase [candidate division KSB1 bacterium]RQW05296.1 MAG: alanine--tRNA ligase [candidate division KSB1 bacterium]